MSQADDVFEYVDDCGGVVGVADLASYLEVPETAVRDYAREHDITRVGNAFAFDVHQAASFAEWLDEAGDDDDGDGADLDDE